MFCVENIKPPCLYLVVHLTCNNVSGHHLIPDIFYLKISEEGKFFLIFADFLKAYCSIYVEMVVILIRLVYHDATLVRLEVEIGIGVMAFHIFIATKIKHNFFHANH